MTEGIHLWITFVLFIVGWAVGFGGACDENDKAIGASLTILGLATALWLFFIVGTCKCDKSPWFVADEPYAVESIVSLGDNNMTNGRIYMRRGYIESDLYYQYMVDIGDGFKANKVRSDNATLYYTDGDCRVEWYTRTKKWLYFTKEETIHKFYIPEGSITDDYSVDLR